ncbi:AAA family ATPase [Vibrio parahaemolyticus]|uniref:AAA family ATPase n=1 Tax=Vibrio harveyi group TaxID=717610 RepID=UPI000824B619|nr:MULTISPECIES: AAA family ATPase [Vibrio harveyi group]EGQ8106917.1 AAA family ATPase [Vibrio parahaemolyticus]EIA1769438.1 AAA family ATPase [Vibrio parahaemolyticus]EIM6119090.1 AAA family ATPase [Vibrio parahaemolyticus]EJG0101437.1 AAA family ATPase [Vibrio parahaemolyticus]EJG0561515.1 AAA family ATPase [Vibrio parahaemolyticus]
MPDIPRETEVSKGIKLRFVELSNFRRLGKVQMNIDQKTTILVGANNSGKTSILAALRHFLTEGARFSAFDISISHWSKLRAIGKVWEELTEDPLTVTEPEEKWKDQLQILLETMPVLDLWFDADVGMYHYVAPFLSKFSWKGGAVGVRLRLEPVTNIEELKQLAWAYRTVRLPVKDMGEDSLAWPIDLLDFWLREPLKLGHVRAYKLDTDNNPITGLVPYVTQKLDVHTSPIDRKHLSRLIRVDFISAQRGLGSEESESRPSSGLHRVGMFSNQLIKFAQQHLNVASSGHSQRVDLVKAVALAQKDLDSKIHEAIADSVKEVKELGYPGLHDPQEIRFRTRIQTADLLDHSTAVQYSMQKDSIEELLPEYSIGLGYQNLQSLSYQLVSFRAARLKPEKGSPVPVHIVMIEEPEAHLHVQVQRIFPNKAHKLISPTEKETSSLNSQLLISTHSSHLAHSENFDRLRYVRRVAKSNATPMPTTEVVHLADVFGDDKKTRQFAERYFRVQHTDLLFANAAIFVEGVAERMLVPLFIERYFKELNSRYVSFVDIGGSHAHRLKPLIEKLRIPTVIITDIDPCEEREGKPKRSGEPTKKLVAVANTGQSGLQSGNPTLRCWHPKLQQLDDFKTPTKEQLVWNEIQDCHVYFAWQLPIDSANNCWPSTFEDSLVLTNISWFKGLMDEKFDENGEEIEVPKGALGSVSKRVVEAKNHDQLLSDLHTLMHGSFNKGDFSASIFELVSSGKDIECPRYIADALTWLQKQLEPRGLME